jgi:competence protein ComFC
MNQRTCSHRLSELYAEIILNDRFKQEFSIKETFYYDNLFVTVFRNHNFKSKLLIVDKESQNILFENICDESYFINESIKNDHFLFAIDDAHSLIRKVINPIYNSAFFENVIEYKHNFIKLSKKIYDIVIKDHVIYFSININGIIRDENVHLNIEFTKENNFITAIDQLSNEFVYQEVCLIVGLDSTSLIEIGRNSFLEGIKGSYPIGFAPNIKILKDVLFRKNTILISVYNSYYMEEITYLIDYSHSILKQLHPPYLIDSNKYYLLIKPLYAYNTYSDFKLIRLSDLNEFDLNIVVNQKVLGITEEDVYKYSIGDFELIEFQNDDILLLDNFVFSCQNLFSGRISPNLKTRESTSFKSLIPIKGNYFDGYALEIHTLKSTLKLDGSFETLRTELGELIYKLKYNFDKSAIEPLAQRCANVIKDTFSNIDVIIPSPPSNLNRPFQPVYELAARISELTKIPVDLDFIKKLPTEQIKTLSNKEDRNIVLERAISIKEKKYESKDILLFDDLFRSGDTLNVIAKKCLNNGGVNNIKALCITKTRTKK